MRGMGIAMGKARGRSNKGRQPLRHRWKRFAKGMETVRFTAGALLTSQDVRSEYGRTTGGVAWTANTPTT